VIEQVRGLSARHLEAVAGLEDRVVAADGGRLKLEWGVLRSRSGREVEDLLWWDGPRLVGFLGLYGFAPPAVEIAGMVDPLVRQRGVFSSLLDAAVPLCLARDYTTALLIVPRVSTAGRAFALHRGATLQHSEHALVLSGAPCEGPKDTRVTLRNASAADAPELQRLLLRAFGRAGPDMSELLAEPRSQTLIAVRDGVPVGTLRVDRDGEIARIYGFAIDPPWQRQGIGRDVLRRACQTLFDEGLGQIGLEVSVDNDHALGLYTSLGFVRVATEDYFSLELGSS
jgi:ribosomal protein S18 acetylase RimI-like enzyme